jgi:hypothetical protein
MKNFILMMIAGSLGAGLTTTFLSKSYETTATAQTLNEAIRSGTCQVTVGFQRLTGSNRCNTQEVMSGVFQNYIYCSKLDVSCATPTPAE